MLPIGLERAEVATNVIRSIERHGTLGNRFMGIDFFEESFNSLSKRNRIWYSIFYCAGHQLDGEYLHTFRMITLKDNAIINRRVSQLTADDWESIGRVMGIDGVRAKNRVYGVFYLR